MVCFDTMQTHTGITSHIFYLMKKKKSNEDDGDEIKEINGL